MTPRVFVTESGALVRIVHMDESYVALVRLDGKGQWSMPRAEYEATFASRYRPATAEDLLGAEAEVPGYELPKNAPDEWRA